MPWAILACFLAISMTTAAQSAPAPEYEVKAAFLYNFAKFVEWPARAFPAPSAPFRLCVLGSDPFGPALDNIVQGKSVAGHPIVHMQVLTSVDARVCHILFISNPNPENLDHVLGQTRDVPVLTVSESDEFLRHGGMINFVLEQDRVRFEINLQAAERHHLKLSSKLLAVARVVNVDQGAN